jgi:glycosyltransferase involved in cell wall biosynthesis
MSNAVLEALASGVAVVASDIPEQREILSPQSLVDPRSAEAWAQRLRSIMADRSSLNLLRASQAESARNLKFDWDDAVYNVLAVCPQ